MRHEPWLIKETNTVWRCDSHYRWVCALTAMPLSLALWHCGQSAGLAPCRPGLESGRGDYALPSLHSPLGTSVAALYAADGWRTSDGNAGLGLCRLSSVMLFKWKGSDEAWWFTELTTATCCSHMVRQNHASASFQAGQECDSCCVWVCVCDCAYIDRKSVV